MTKTPKAPEEFIKEWAKLSLVEFETHVEPNLPRFAADWGWTVTSIMNSLAEARNALETETELVLGNFSDIQERRVDWLWQQKIPRDVLASLFAVLGSGKTTIVIDLSARFTTGREWPDGSPNTNPPGEVLFVVEEDALDTIVKPRLLAAGADISKCHYLVKVQIRKGARKAERMLALDQDLGAISRMLEKHPAIKLIVIDPLTSYLGKVNMDKDQELRPVLLPLNSLCQERRINVIAIAHPNKRSDVGASGRAPGGAGMASVPRATWFCGADPDEPGQYLLVMLRVTAARDRSGMRYAFGDKEIPNCGVQPYIVWKGKTEKTADDLLDRLDSRERKTDIGIAAVKEFLKGGPQLSTDVYKHLESKGVSRRTAERVRDELNRRKELQVRTDGGNGQYRWHLWHGSEEASAKKPKRKPGEPPETTFGVPKHMGPFSKEDLADHGIGD